MRAILIGAASILFVAVLAACDDGLMIVDGEKVYGSGAVITEDRDVGSFDRITLAGEGRVVVVESAVSGISIATDDNLMKHIDTVVTGGALTIATENGIDIEPSNSVTYVVSTPHVTGVTLTGAGSFELGECVTDAFSIGLTGAGDINIGRLVADELDVTIAGAGEVSVSGEVASQMVALPGVGDYRAEDLESASAVVTTTGVGSATVWVTDSLVATVAGVGGIDYFGSPEVASTVTGIGSINGRGDR